MLGIVCAQNLCPISEPMWVAFPMACSQTSVFFLLTFIFILQLISMGLFLTIYHLEEIGFFWHTVGQQDHILLFILGSCFTFIYLFCFRFCTWKMPLSWNCQIIYRKFFHVFWIRKAICLNTGLMIVYIGMNLLALRPTIGSFITHM